MTSRWTRVDDLIATLRKRWDRGHFLRRYAAGETWQPVTVPVRAPTAAELLDDFDKAVQWADRFRRDSRTAGGRPRFAVEHRTIKGKGLGANEVPARIRVDTFEQLSSLLGTTSEVRVLDAILDQTRREVASIRWCKSRRA